MKKTKIMQIGIAILSVMLILGFTGCKPEVIPKSKLAELIDIKVEFGMVNGEIALIDEISAGNMRVYENNKKLDYLTLASRI